MTRYLLRHGESEWNVLGRTQGQVAHPRLTSRGVEQVRAAAAAIVADLGPDRRVDLVRTSDLARARQTAELVAGIVGARVEVDARLREQSYGVFDGADAAGTEAALARLAGEPDADTRALPGGESAEVVRARVRAAVADVPARVVTVVVGHGDAFRLAFGPYPDSDRELAGARGVLPEPWPNGAVAVLGPDGSLCLIPLR